MSQAVRVRIAAPAAWARRLVARFTRGGLVQVLQFPQVFRLAGAQEDAEV